MNSRDLSIKILIGYILLFLLVSSSPYVLGGCPKCMGRDYSLYTEGYIFDGGQEISVRLANIDDKNHHIEYIDLFIIYPDNTSMYIGRFELNRTIQPGTSYPFTIKLPEVDRDVNASLYALINGDVEVYSNDFTIRSLSGRNPVDIIGIVLMVLSVLIAVVIWARYMRD